MTPTNLTSFRLSKAAKEGLLRGEQQRIDTKPQKLQAAIAWLGKRYCCHKVNRVEKLPEPLPENYLWQPRARRK